jgi:hypothetical protein
MSECNFYTPEEVRPLYGEIVPAYQAAFSGEPWYEVSKCADQLKRCVGGLSSLAIGTTCELCGNRLTQPAYEAGELTERFDTLANSRPTAWYTEINSDGLTLAAIAWKATPSVIAEEKYPDVPVMERWLEANPGDNEIIWLDEVFANKNLKPQGNLQNFGKFVTGLAGMLEAQTVAYRTKEPRMLTAAKRDFKQVATIFNRKTDVPDRRDFIIIRLDKEQ